MASMAAMASRENVRTAARRSRARVAHDRVSMNTPSNVPVQRRTIAVLGIPVDADSQASMLRRIAKWAQAGESRYVCACNVHSLITATKSLGHLEALRGADLVTPDGAPVAWMLRRLGAPEQDRVSGPDLMLEYCASAAVTGEPLFLFGGSDDTLRLLQERLLERWPQLRIAGAMSPPFRQMSPEEDSEVIRRIGASGARTVWVGLGCPKQEIWMAAHRGLIPAVMIGVGAAFDFHAGTTPRAPAWMRRRGLEWLHRLASDPKRLWRRYLVTNTAFAWRAALQLTKSRDRT